jgi:hypothetical protein
MKRHRALWLLMVALSGYPESQFHPYNRVEQASRLPVETQPCASPIPAT